MWFRKAIQSQQKLAIAYPPPGTIKPEAIWQQLVGIAKYLSRTGETATWEQLQQKLKISDRTLDLGIITLKSIGFAIEIQPAEAPNQQILQVKNSDFPIKVAAESTQLVTDFLAAVQEEQFLQTYFYQVPLATLQSMVWQS
jgi:single-stranded-DNA-specific exonuclease